MKDPYKVLNVAKSADEKEIKSAYRKLAKKWHPDQNQENPKAKERFAEISHAYDILGDKEKRGRFDRGEIDADGKERFSGFSGGDPFGPGSPFGNRQHSGGSNPFGGTGGFSGAEDILSEMFGQAFGHAQAAGRQPNGGQFHRGARQAKSDDVKLKTFVTIDDLLRGKTTVTLPDGRKIAASIPAGASDGQKIRLKAKAPAKPGQAAGDVLVTLVFRANSDYAVDGHDLRGEVDIPLEIAVLGGTVKANTPEGKVSLKIPAWTNSGKIFRIPGRGLPKKGSGMGDLKLRAILVLPENPDPRLLKAFKVSQA